MHPSHAMAAEPAAVAAAAATDDVY